ncbi:UDP-glucose 4-epimerase GalE [Actinospica sp. MGRD01-02]|uniref:UDP-glucose 4-epimerase n=1 Tax=Actinospica acidithermotolerans TaxID=2828514 RepID=A0A941IHV4_9ACTN|nr:UDP-glucose 4-epimerase GalE [Actinospica acidithermotolerans]MBR7827639.1 UDP-glucose 4-epimerase GalE [Actinospica acidithermotolerans]
MTESATVLVTGGAGFIGSHTCVDLLEHGYEVIVVDDHSNSSPGALHRVEKVAGRPLLATYPLDVRDEASLDGVFRDHRIDAVVHFAAKKAIGESIGIPLDYYSINVSGLISLLRAMHRHEVHRLVFSSSCSIYGDARPIPLGEQEPPRPTNPYSRSKLMCEEILADACRAWPELTVFSLRYFNPAGAHTSGLLGEDPRGVPNNVMPYAMQVAIGRRERLSIFGGDYSTPDGTAVRDYIHVMDVADGHREALERLYPEASSVHPGLHVLNLGTGVGTSVLELVESMSSACGQRLPYEIVGRRAGDVAHLVADPTAVAREWGWHTTRDLSAMCADAWRFQQLNPNGYQD